VPFDTPEFVAFVLLVLIGYHACFPRRAWRARFVFLLVASWAFYASWRPGHLWLLLGSTALTWGGGLAIARCEGERRRVLLALLVAADLALLGVFKYADFAVTNVGWLLGRPVDAYHSALGFVLPIGISFYTFESISYLVDVGRGTTPSKRFRDVGLFLAFFPHLVAGPIVRPRGFLPQLAQAASPSGRQVELGLARIAAGFAKKMILADTLARYVDEVLVVPEAYPGANLLLAIYAYAFQIYFDFSGYSDIAIGTAQLFGLDLPENFERPYLATSPRDFWRRWHITLSTWLRDYVYVPLGGNRRSRTRTYANLLATMLLGGLWHGAAWHFVLWGGWHGALLVGEHAVLGRALDHPKHPWVGRLVTFHLVCLGWVLFRAPSLSHAAAVVQGLVRPGVVVWQTATLAALVVAVGVVLHVSPPAVDWRSRLTALPPLAQGASYAALAIVIAALAPGSSPFIYFQF
jgi:D-alanyl-lipoteichoic acid acyltransferase DltB (MBOAT superfamily)